LWPGTNKAYQASILMTPTKLRNKRATMKPRLLLLTAIAIAITAVSGCASDATPTPTLVPYVDLHSEHGKPFDLRLTNSAFLFAGDQTYRLDFTNMVSDSRCAIGNECLRPDVAVVEVTLTNLSSGAGSVTHSLFFDAGPSEAILGPFTVQVLAVAPAVEEVVSPSEYAVTLLVHVTPAADSLDVQMTSSGTSAKVGDHVTYTASASAAGFSRAQYILLVNGVIVGITHYDGTLSSSSRTPVIELIDWTANATSASWTIEVRADGAFEMEASILALVDGDQGVVSAQGRDGAQLSVN
jgi:hypothetical protein